MNFHISKFAYLSFYFISFFKIYFILLFIYLFFFDGGPDNRIVLQNGITGLLFVDFIAPNRWKQWQLTGLTLMEFISLISWAVIKIRNEVWCGFVAWRIDSSAPFLSIKSVRSRRLAMAAPQWPIEIWQICIFHWWLVHVRLTGALAVPRLIAISSLFNSIDWIWWHRLSLVAEMQHYSIIVHSDSFGMWNANSIRLLKYLLLVMAVR